MSFNELSIMSDKKGTVLFYPYIPKKSLKILKKTLSTRWIGQGPMVDKFEKKFSDIFLNGKECVSTGSGTDALHLAYLLAGIKKNDEVITPVFTCTATNIPLLYIGAKIKFADVDPKTMNISIESLKKLITKKTKAIVCVHYGGIPCDMDEIRKLAKKHNIKVIEDAAQAIGGEYKKKKIGTISDFTIFSFQAIKHITTGDGGMLCIKNSKLIDSAKRMRWFGIDRKKKQLGVWENDVYEVGYKYQLTDLGASIGYQGLLDFNKILSHRIKIYNIYLKNLSKNPNITCIHDYDKNKKSAAWLFTILTKRKNYLQKKLREKNIETNQVHFRNDKYSIFKKFVKNKKFKNMDKIEDEYLVLPIHTKVSAKNAEYICKLINSFI
jgi:dTDP-4-amino-4,6-dideoxygalactose transaminase|tara:strand:+ start:4169 stop:5311 length:1143 start_codon:yes stop_codon:yes gene_type:complete